MPVPSTWLRLGLRLGLGLGSAEHLAKRREAHAVQVGILSVLRSKGLGFITWCGVGGVGQRHAWGGCRRRRCRRRRALPGRRGQRGWCWLASARAERPVLAGAGWRRRTLMNICVVRLSVPLVANEM